jgi:AcrR family transcriptional regulator
MKSRVKPKRRYDATLRLERAAALRERVLNAARRLFARYGFDGVTIEQLAQAADVSPATVYAAFKSKAGVLKAIIQKTFFGDDYEVLAERVKATTDPVELLKLTAAISRVIFDHERAEIGIIRGASAFSAELKRVEKEFENLRYELQRPRAELLVSRYRRAAALGISKVRDTMWMLTGRDLYRMLVMERGWSPDAYEEFLAATLIRMLTDD